MLSGWRVHVEFSHEGDFMPCYAAVWRLGGWDGVSIKRALRLKPHIVRCVSFTVSQCSGLQLSQSMAIMVKRRPLFSLLNCMIFLLLWKQQMFSTIFHTIKMNTDGVELQNGHKLHRSIKITVVHMICVLYSSEIMWENRQIYWKLFL